MKDDKIEKIRKELPAVSSCVYLNTGTNGPLCRTTAEIMKEESEKTIEMKTLFRKLTDQIMETLRINGAP